jgi:hypothetical protein
MNLTDLHAGSSPYSRIPESMGDTGETAIKRPDTSIRFTNCSLSSLVRDENDIIQMKKRGLPPVIIPVTLTCRYGEKQGIA